MFDMTVSEACEALGIGRTRVLQLIKNGVLDAEKIGNTWVIDRRSIDSRKQKEVHAGRPPKHDKNAQRFILMNRDHEILSFRFDSSNGDFYDIDEIMDASRAPLSIMSPRGKQASKSSLANWWAHRAIPGNRAGIESKLLELGLNETYDLPFRSFGLSLSDQYWIKPYGAQLKWGDINYFDNPFVTVEVENWLADVGLDSPDNTSDGVLSKRWVKEGDKCILLKGGSSLNQEPYNEVIATELYSRLLVDGDYVPYEFKKWGGSVVSACPCFIDSTEEFIPAYYVKENMKAPESFDDLHAYMHQCYVLGIHDIETMLSKMMVCDFILANSDRHWRNFGIIRNVETLEYRIAPIFDSGTSLWCRIPTTELEYAGFALESKPFYNDSKRQLRAAPDVSWLDLDKLTGFPEWAAELLEENPMMRGRTDFIFEGLQKNIDYVRAVFE